MFTARRYRTPVRSFEPLGVRLGVRADREPPRRDAWGGPPEPDLIGDLAEREGFEPSKQVTPLGGLANRCTRPLCDLSDGAARPILPWLPGPAGRPRRDGAGSAPSNRQALAWSSISGESGHSPVKWRRSHTKRPTTPGSPVAWGRCRTRLGTSGSPGSPRARPTLTAGPPLGTVRGT